jgi:ferredoxin-NADP reductase
LATVKKYKTTVSNIEHLLPDVYTLTLTPQDGRFRFKPGQFLHLTLDEYDPSRQWPESRCFSIQSNPEEDCLQLTFSIKGIYTKRMAQELHVGKAIWIKMPYGELFENDSSKEQCVFLAGGTGVTPYLSLFTSKAFSAYYNPVLYFGVRNENYHIYRDAFAKAIQINPAMIITVVYAESEGLLNLDSIYDQHGNSAVYFLSGPPVMIKSFKHFLELKGLPKGNIKTDEWE